jgi:two-component system, cell cycle response regulator
MHLRWVYSLCLIPWLTEYLESGEVAYTPRKLITEVVVSVLLIVLARVITQQAGRLAAMAETDQLTGLHNRHRFNVDLAREAARAVRQKSSLTLAYFDLDRFKSVNDEHGHLVGDELLAKVARRLCASGRTNVDTCYRLGGDEFAMLLPSLAPEDASAAVDRIVGAVEADDDGITHFGGGVSVGVAALKPGESLDEFISRADDCMYARKHQRQQSAREGRASSQSRR